MTFERGVAGLVGLRDLAEEEAVGVKDGRRSAPDAGDAADMVANVLGPRIVPDDEG